MQFFRYDTIDSTNEQARRLLAEDAITDAACVIARAQTAGRGTRGRSWISPPDAGLYLTLVERRDADAPLRTTTLYTVAAGIACARVLRDLTGLPVTIKPVNDLSCHGGKLGGILCESVIDRGRMTVLIVGIGINTRRVMRPVMDGRTFPATDLETLLGPSAASPEPAALVDALLPALREWIRRVDGNVIAELRAEWEKLSTGPFPFPAEDPG